MSRKVPAVHAGPAAWVFAVGILLPKKTRNLQEKSKKSSLPVDHPAG